MTPGQTSAGAEGTSEIKRLLRGALDEEERRLNALEERVQRLATRKSDPDESLPALPPAQALGLGAGSTSSPEPSDTASGEDPVWSDLRSPAPEAFEEPQPAGFRDGALAPEALARRAAPPPRPSPTIEPPAAVASVERALPAGFSHLPAELTVLPPATPVEQRGEFRGPTRPPTERLEAPRPSAFQTARLAPGGEHELPAPAPAAPIATPTFAELALPNESTTTVYAPFEEPPPVELKAARQLIDESSAHLRELERRLEGLEGEPAREFREEQPVEPLPREARPRGFQGRGSGPDAHRALKPSRYELDRAFASGPEPDWREVLRDQHELRERVLQIAEEIDGIQAAAAERDAELVGRAERAERACVDALEKVTSLTARVEALTKAVEGLAARVTASSAAAPPPAAPQASKADPELQTTQQLIRLLQSGGVPRPVGDPLSSAEIARDPMRGRLMTTVNEHQGLLRDHARLLERLVRLQEEGR